MQVIILHDVNTTNTIYFHFLSAYNYIYFWNFYFRFHNFLLVLLTLFVICPFLSFAAFSIWDLLNKQTNEQTNKKLKKGFNSAALQDGFKKRVFGGGCRDPSSDRRVGSRKNRRPTTAESERTGKAENPNQLLLFPFYFFNSNLLSFFLFS